MIRRPPRSTRTVTLLPYTTLFRSLDLDRGAYANRVLSRLILLPTIDQVRVWNEIIGEYRAKIDELDMRGINPLRSKELPGRWRIVERRLFEGAEGGTSPFDQDRKSVV